MSRFQLVTLSSMRLRRENCYFVHERHANQASFSYYFFFFFFLLLSFPYTYEHDQQSVIMFSGPLLILSIKIVVALAASPLLEIIRPALVASSVNIGASPLNSTALREADASARALSQAGVHNTQSSHVSVLSPPKHATTIKPPRLIPSIVLISITEIPP